ncbi:MAG: undecaprenyl-diphosphate phosphatase [Polyangiaceae bacterium]
MNPLHAILLGLVEGLTEFLPVSSTGHLILVAHALGYAEDNAAMQAFEVVIQLGALLAVFVHYRSLLSNRVQGLFKKDDRAIRLAIALIVGFVPIGVTGLLFRKLIKQYFFGPSSVAGALIVGGLVMIVMAILEAKKVLPEGADSVDEVTWKRALIIGLGQCFALIPAHLARCRPSWRVVSQGLSTAASAEFSFLALPSLGAATVYEMLKSRHELFEIRGGAMSLSIGMLVSFVSCMIATFLTVLRRFGLAPWGVYRIIVAAAVLVLLAKPLRAQFTPDRNVAEARKCLLKPP